MHEEFDGLGASALAEIMDKLDREIDAKKDELSELTAKMEHLRFVRLPAKMDEEGVTSLRLASGRGVTRKDEMLVSVLAADREAQHQWLQDIGADSLITPTVNAASFQSFVRERLGAMQEVPDFVKLCARPRVNFLGEVRRRS